MCKLFVGADPALWESTTRSIRLDGMVSSLRLENIFWATLDDIAERDALSVNQLVNNLQRELTEAAIDLGNFASFLRVCCLRYLSLQTQGLIPAGAYPISLLSAEQILAAESELLVRRRTAKLREGAGVAPPHASGPQCP